MHNLSTVILFEFVRTLKKKSFWLSILAVPALMGALLVVIYFSTQSAAQVDERLAKEKFSLMVMDDSGLLSPQILQSVEAQLVSDPAQARAAVRQGQVEAFFHYPADLMTQPIQITAQDVGFINNQRYQSVAEQLLQASVSQQIKPASVVAIINGQFSSQLTTYKNGEVQPGLERILIPGSFLVIFYAVIVLLTGRLIASTTEEKENRVIEIILTTVNARTLVLGKIIAVALIGLVQVAVIVIPAIVGYQFVGSSASIPSVNLADISIAPHQLIVGITALIFGFLLITGSTVAIGAAVPTAKEANNFFGVVIMAMLIPLYAFMSIVSDPENILVQVVTYFPFTAPVALLLRNSVDNIQWWQAAISLSILALTSLLSLLIAARAFSHGTLEYSRKLSLKEIFRFK